jgi:cytochrome d ubiquinol oxidase subunit I
VAFVVGAVGGYHLLRNQANPAARVMFSMALWMGLIAAPLQVAAGDAQGLNTRQYQPAKIAALEGDFDTRPGTPLILFGWPDMARETTDYPIEIPHLGALVLTHTWNGAVRGLKSFPPQDRPYSPVVFIAFRIMVGLGFLMVFCGLAGAWMRYRGGLYQARWLQRVMVAMAPAGFIALLAGWTVTEVGRQPFTVYGLLRTVQSASPIGVPGVATSLAAFAVVYLIVFGSGLVFLLRMLAKPPVPFESGPPKALPVRTAGIMPGPAIDHPNTVAGD